ncbi:MAG TPA: hypothetical protein VHX38_28810 [Pseudonocardiaceae bacterium]|jgi:hypothetical protein|nr:hypothetical protein [Pseudonocardiaceae bacterium]
MTSEPERILLDLSKFEDPQEAMALAAYGCPKSYTEVAMKHMMDRNDLTTDFMLFGSFVSRMRGLHEGVIREIDASNSHAVLPLIRAWVETIAIALYVLRKPSYADYLLYGPGNNRPAHKTFTAMFHAVREDASQLKLVYGELSDYSHFGSLAVWNAHSIDDEEQRTVSWTDTPRWRDEKHFQVACAWAHELSQAGLDALDRLGELLIPTAPGTVSKPHNYT